MCLLYSYIRVIIAQYDEQFLLYKMQPTNKLINFAFFENAVEICLLSFFSILIYEHIFSWHPCFYLFSICMYTAIATTIALLNKCRMHSEFHFILLCQLNYNQLKHCDIRWGTMFCGESFLEEHYWFFYFWCKTVLLIWIPIFAMHAAFGAILFSEMFRDDLKVSDPYYPCICYGNQNGFKLTLINIYFCET